MDKQQICRVGFHPTHFLIGVLALLASNLFAGPLSDAQKYYEEGNVAEALEQFQQVQYKDPNEVTLLYNQANCQYKLDQTDLAVELFEKVLSQSSDPSLQAKAHFNLGNCFFRQAAAQPDDKNRQNVLKKLQSAVKHYRQALMLNPDDAEAKHNLALARHLMGQIIAQIQQQEKQQQQDQEQKEDLAKKIRQLLKRQNDLIGNTNTIQQAQQLNVADPNVIASQRQYLSSSQSRLKDDTSAVQNEAQQMLDQQQQQGAGPSDLPSPQNNAPTDPSVYEVVNNEIILAVDNQGQAADDLNNNKIPDSLVDQTEAAQHLQNALDALKQDQDKDQQKQKKDQDKKEDSENKQDDSKQENKEKQDSQDKDQQEKQQSQSKQDQSEEKKDQNQNDQEAKPLDMTAQQILDKEKERNQQKRKVILRGGKGVEKNW